MRIFEEKEVPAVQSKTIKECICAACDICGSNKTSSAPLTYSGECDWATDPFEIMETTLAWTTGYRYPECSKRVVHSFHVCPACFSVFIIPYIKSLMKRDHDKDFNVDPTVDEIDL